MDTRTDHTKLACQAGRSSASGDVTALDRTQPFKPIALPTCGAGFTTAFLGRFGLSAAYRATSPPGVGHPGTGRMVNRRIFPPRKANPKVSETGLPGKSPAISAMARWPSSVGSTVFTV